MIRHRLDELGTAVARAIEMLRAARHVEAVVQEVLELIGRAACSERASFWTVDADLRRLQTMATWSAREGGAPTAVGEIRQRITSLSLSNAGHVWRSRKPLWSTSLVLDMAPPSFDGGLRGGLWFAVKTDTSVYGVIELLGRALEPQTPDNLVLIERLGFRLGQALEDLRHGAARLH